VPAFLREYEQDLSDTERIEALLARHIEQGMTGQELVSPEDLCADSPELLEELQERIHEYEALKSRLDKASPPVSRAMEVVSRTLQRPADSLAADATLAAPPSADTAAGSVVHKTGVLKAGGVISARYQIRSMLGKGGMGEVWRAQDLRLSTEVALKAMIEGVTADAHALEIQRGEVRAAREVISPNVCRIFDLVVADGRELVSMEYIDGSTLTQVIEERGPLELREATEIASQLLAGLEAIHAVGLVHRDIKPENVMLTRTGRVVVMDLGLARAADDTGTGSISGTPAYMAPEQMRGDPLDARADLFACGILLAELLCLDPADPADSRRSLWKAVRQQPPELPDSPWAPVLQKAVAADPEDRYATALELARALEEVTLRAEVAEDLQPYPGLAAFTEDDAEYFFGREAEIEKLWTKLLVGPRLMALVGPSGAGKSSFLRAGLVATRPASSAVIVSTPANDPWTLLGHALADQLTGDTEAMRQLVGFQDADVAVSLLARWAQQSEGAFLFVDQFEELFTQCAAEEQIRFADLLARLPLEAGICVLLSMRDDFLLHCHHFPALSPLFSNLTPIEAPAGSTLRRALVRPALSCGYHFESDSLVDEMLAEVQGGRGALPLLAFAAASLWERRDRQSGQLTRDAYERIGGVGGALAQHAEDTLESIAPDRRALVREIFRNLATSAGTRLTRDVDDLLSVFPDGEAASEVIDVLVDARLLTTFEAPSQDDEQTRRRIEIVHESLLRAWPRLVRWQTQDAEGALMRDHLRQAAGTWQDRGRAEDLLWTGTAFREYRLWKELYPGGLSQEEAAFATAMEELAGRQRRRRRTAVAAAFVLLGAVVIGIGGLWRRSEVARGEALVQASRAEASKLLALGRLELDADASRSDPSMALAHAIASLETADSPAARLFAVETLSSGPTAHALGSSFHYTAAFSPDAQWLAHTEAMNLPVLQPSSGGPPIAMPQLESSTLRQMVFDSQSRRLVTYGSGPTRVEVWTLEGEQLASYPFDSLYARFFVRADDLTIVHGGNGELIFERGSLSGGELQELGRLPAPHDSSTISEAAGAFALGVDPLGETLALAIDRDLRLFSLKALGSQRGRSVGSFAARIYGVAFSPDGARIAVAEDSGRLTTWAADGSTPVPLRSAIGRPSQKALRFDSTGQRLAIANFDGSTTVWDLSAPPDADLVLLHTRQAIAVVQASFAPAGQLLVSAPQGQGALVWDLDRPAHYVLRGHRSKVHSVDFSPDGNWLATASADGTVRLWPLSPDAGTQHRILLDRPAAGFAAARFSPDGETLAVSQPGISLLDTSGGAQRELEGFERAQWPLHFSADGRRLVTASGPYNPDGKARIWDLESGTAKVLDPPAGEAVPRYNGLEMSADERWLIGSDLAGPAVLWDLETGSATWLRPASGVAFSRDGRRVFMAGSGNFSDGVVGSLDLATNLFEPLGSFEDATRLVLDPSGERLVAASGNGMIQVGPVDGGAPHFLYGHEGFIQDIAVSRDGRWIASAGDDLTVRLWAMPEGEPLQTMSHSELLAKLSSLTNARVVADESSNTGYASEWSGAFPGWETPVSR
jgi:WD40 repeat protein